MLSINTNLGSLIVQSNLSKSTLGLQQAIERMTTGFKINHAKDNAAGYSIATNMSTKISAYGVAEDNVSMGLDMVNTASEALNQISDRLSRLRALTMQAQNGTYGETSIEALRQEAEAIVDEINRTMSTSEYNGIKLFGESNKPVINGTEVVLNSDGFMVDVVHRDTTGMTSMSDVDETQTITGGTYSISTPEELAKFMRMSTTSGGGRIRGGEFVLGGNIDMSGITVDEGNVENITFDGNGYVISNLREALFDFLNDSEIKNLGLRNINLTDNNQAWSPLGMQATNTNITNCYATGSIEGTSYVFGGLVGSLEGGTIESCWTDVDINATSLANGGIVGALSGTVSNSFSLGEVNNINGGGYAGGIAGIADGTIENCYTSSKVSSEYGSAYEYVIANNDENNAFGNGALPLTITNVTYDSSVNGDMSPYGTGAGLITASGITAQTKSVPDITLQVGINSDASSRLTFSTAFTFNDLSSDIENPNMLTTLDDILASLSNKQTNGTWCGTEPLGECVGVYIGIL